MPCSTPELTALLLTSVTPERRKWLISKANNLPCEGSRLARKGAVSPMTAYQQAGAEGYCRAIYYPAFTPRYWTSIQHENKISSANGASAANYGQGLKCLCCSPVRRERDAPRNSRDFWAFCVSESSGRAVAQQHAECRPSTQESDAPYSQAQRENLQAVSHEQRSTVMVDLAPRNGARWKS